MSTNRIFAGPSNEKIFQSCVWMLLLFFETEFSGKSLTVFSQNSIKLDSVIFSCRQAFLTPYLHTQHYLLKFNFEYILHDNVAYISKESFDYSCR